MNIFQKMAAISAEAPRIGKDLLVANGKSGSYNATSETAILEAVKKLEEKYGIYSYPVESSRTPGNLTREFFSSDRGPFQRTYRVDDLESKYRFVNLENTDEHVDITTYGTGVDLFDKAPGKAMTYARKYAYILAYHLIREDNPDDPDTVSEIDPDEKELSRTVIPDNTDTLDKSADEAASHTETEVTQEEVIEDKPKRRGRPRKTVVEEQETKAETPAEQLVSEEASPAAETITSAPTAEPVSAEVSSDAMTMDDAKAYIFPFGTFSGKTLEEVNETNPEKIVFYATNEKYAAGAGNKFHPELRKACRAFLGMK